MLDQDFLEKAILSVAFLCQTLPKQMVAIKNIHSINIFCSDFLATRTGLTIDQLVGKKIWLSLYEGDETFEKVLMAEDQAIISSRVPKVILKINRFCDGLMPYLAIKTPLINPETNNVVGILSQGYEIGTANLTKNIIQKMDSHKKTVHLKDRPKLSKREKEIIFFFMANLSSQEIADIIGAHEGKSLTKSTIDSVFNHQLYLKFDVYNRVALYQKLQTLGYDQLIPKTLLSKMSVMLDVMQTY
jgi:hypothetical protein